MAVNVNKKHKESLGFNDRIGLTITNIVGTMWIAYIFAGLAFVALPSAIQQGSPTVLVNWLSSNFLQLVLLPLIMVGQNLQSRKDVIRAENDYETDKKAEEKIETILARLESQGKDIIKILEELEKRK